MRCVAMVESLHPLDAGIFGRFLIFLEDVLGHALRLLVEGFLKGGLHVFFGGFGLSSGVANHVGDCAVTIPSFLGYLHLALLPAFHPHTFEAPWLLGPSTQGPQRRNPSTAQITD